jgi:hypothetical protein
LVSIAVRKDGNVTVELGDALLTESAFSGTAVWYREYSELMSDVAIGSCARI